MHFIPMRPATFWPFLLVAWGCVDLTPPWEKNRGLDAGKDVLRVLDSQGLAGASGGSGGVGGSGGTGGSVDTGGAGGSTEPGGAGGSDAADAAVPLPDAGTLDAKFENDVPPTPGSDAADAPLVQQDTGLSDARTDRYRTEGGGAGGATGDAARDIAVDEIGGTGGGPGGTGGTSTGGTSTGGAGGSMTPDAAPLPPDGGLSSGLVAYYSCDQTAGPTLTDQSGNKKNGTLSGGYSFSQGKFGSALSFDVANKGYATLPADLLAGASDVTIATWVYLNSNPNWQRVWDFGKDTNVYLYLTTNSYTHLLRSGITMTGNTNEKGVQTDALPLNTWKHVTLVLNAAGATIYVDGQQKANNAAVVLRPVDLGSMPNYLIGRSQFSADPYLDGKVDEFRIYNRALSAQEIQALFTGS